MEEKLGWSVGSDYLLIGVVYDVFHVQDYKKTAETDIQSKLFLYQYSMA